jgi:hypothetical protein
MSKQRHLLIPAFLVLVCGLAAQTGAILRTGFGSYRDPSLEGYRLSNQLLLERDLAPGLEFSLASDLHAADLAFEQNPQKRFHSAAASLRFKRGGLALKGSYRNTAYGSSSLFTLWPALSPVEFQRKSMQHQAFLDLSYGFDPLSLKVSGSHRHLRYAPYLLDPQSFELVEQDAAGADDLYLDTRIDLNLGQGMAAFAGADYQDGLFADGQYSLSGLTLGVTADRKLGTGLFATAALSVTNRDGQAVPEQRRNLVQSQFRIHYDHYSRFNAWISFINASFLDAPVQNLCFNSNCLRAQIQWNTAPEVNDLSNLRAGVRSTRSLGEDYYLEGNQRLLGRVYAGARIDYLPKLDPRYQANLSWFFTPLNELSLIYRHRGKQVSFGESDYLCLGSSIYW